MTQTTIIGFPRFGAHRELKTATEQFFRGKSDQETLLEAAKAIRLTHWQLLQEAGIDLIPSNDFSLYDQVLDTAVLFNIIPAAVQNSQLSPLQQYFALARGHQDEHEDIKALPMKKWFHTNYHYLVPTFEKERKIQLTGDKIIAEYLEAKEAGIDTRPVLIGPFTLLQLSEFDEGVKVEEVAVELVQAYQALFRQLAHHGVQWLQLDEPSLVKDIQPEERERFLQLYQELLKEKAGLSILVQTYFGDVRDVYQDLIALPIDGLGLDFVEGPYNKELVAEAFPDHLVLHAGVINGKNIWRTAYRKVLDVLDSLNVKQLVLSSSCSLLHVPFSVSEEPFPAEVKQHIAFATEKLDELITLKAILEGEGDAALKQNEALVAAPRISKNHALAERIQGLSKDDFIRHPAAAIREEKQRTALNLPLLPATTIGSFPQTQVVKQTRAKYKAGSISEAEYEQFLQQRTKEWLKWQEEVGLDVLVHGEFERNDMVEYFAEQLEGYLFTKNGWVQSYGTRGVKPPIVWGDIQRVRPMTVGWSTFAQAQSDRPVKGMLTGPVTILNWSFPREDVPLQESALQLALAIQEEVLDLEAHGIRVIQIDEAALREKLPLRRSDWYSDYLDWAIPAFRLVHSRVRPETQIHTHMCYSEFTDIIPAIERMDADVISFEASRSNLHILDELQRQKFALQVGPGVYDIHSPRVPTVDEFHLTIQAILAKVPSEKVWINPDCGLKTRGESTTKASLTNMLRATQQIRKEV